MPALPLGNKSRCGQIPAVNQRAGAPIGIAANPSAAWFVMDLRPGLTAALAGGVLVEVLHNSFLLGFPVGAHGVR